uniref:Uncharacterized protein n=1 Tax=Leersia perrieri TaxID=77586 RepID=A0A0D9WZD7_9ORYZ
MASGVRREEEEEFDEGEVWDVLHQDPRKEATSAAAALAAVRIKAKTTKQKHEEGEAARRSRGMRSSAPVAIPAAGSSSSRRGGGGGEDDEEEEMMMLPPHEWLARKMERMSAAAPEIGRGRSKGREMRKVRDAVLSKTAFSSEQ